VTTGAASTTTTLPTEVAGKVVTSTQALGVADSSLPRTGDPSVPLVVAGAVLIVAGLALIVLDRFRERRVHA
jgi:LPXTG-motif cell wall-anchored protein